MGQAVKLTMTSEDVIHNFFIPAFRVKNDVLPGRYTSIWFKPTKPGKYRLFCAEYCGTEHSYMGGWVYVVPQAEYESWQRGASQVQDSPVVAGSKLFAQFGCATCHNADAGARGPDLVGLFGHEVALQDGSKVIADESYIRESIVNSQSKIVAGYVPLMPIFQGLISEDQLSQLVAYIKSLNKAGTGGSAQ
jgi:cytochrome c oxidase subunit 2